jgi:hypothetical protein
MFERQTKILEARETNLLLTIAKSTNRKLRERSESKKNVKLLLLHEKQRLSINVRRHRQKKTCRLPSRPNKLSQMQNL